MWCHNIPTGLVFSFFTDPMYVCQRYDSDIMSIFKVMPVLCIKVVLIVSNDRNVMKRVQIVHQFDRVSRGRDPLILRVTAILRNRRTTKITEELLLNSDVK